jgi:PadR family transcriptional regulator PadR
MTTDPTLSRIEILQGTLDLIILQTLRWGPQHGYGIIQRIRTGSGSALQVETGSLYPALHRLARRKWVSAEWTISESGQRVRVYALTATGRKQLAAKTSKWERLAQAISALRQPPPEDAKA